MIIFIEKRIKLFSFWGLKKKNGTRILLTNKPFKGHLFKLKSRAEEFPATFSTAAANKVDEGRPSQRRAQAESTRRHPLALVPQA